MRIVVREQLDPRSAHAVLCHELAHIYLGHLGSDEDNWWPCRINLPHGTVEIEAEAASYIVCQHLGITTHSADYLSDYIQDEKDFHKVSIDLVTRVASRIEAMGKRTQSRRKRRSQTEDTKPEDILF
jgi:antirestriction protein ArdC